MIENTLDLLAAMIVVVILVPFAVVIMKTKPWTTIGFLIGLILGWSLVRVLT